ncbi:MAG: methyl-accepting chemotaxis protein [Nibricoccus sp.]
MKNWTIAKRITTGGTTLLVLLLVVSAVAVSALSRLETFAGKRLRDDAIPGIVYASELTSQTLRGYIRLLMAANAPTEAKRDDHLAKGDKAVEDASKAMDSYEQRITAAEDRANFEDLKVKRAAFREARATYIAFLKANKIAEAEAFEQEKMEPLYFSFREQITKIAAWNEAVAIKVTEEMVTTSHGAKFVATLVASLSILTALVLGWIIIRSTNRALQQMAGSLDDASSQVAAAARQVSVGSQSLAEGASEQASSLEESSSSLEELASMTKRNAESAVSAKTFSGEARIAANAGNGDMTEMRRAMDAIKTSSNDIANIIKSIDEIAFQTNILALNAAVEAARAGAAGAGFAVVADEVRALAQRSATSAKETASKIEVAIQNSDHGVRISEKVASSLGVILEKVLKVDELVAEISTASSEQNQGISQINTAVSQMDKVTQSNAANAEETAAAAEELTAQSASLKDTVGHLRELVGGNDKTNQPAISEPDAPAKSVSALPRKRSTFSGPALISTRPPQRHKPLASTGSHNDANGNFFKDA